MKQINMRFLSSVFVLCVFGIADAAAAPSVKMLGTNTARIGSNTQAVAPNTKSAVSTQPQQRLSSVRMKTMAGGTPTTIKSTTASTSAGTDSRISLGNASVNKYLHSPAANMSTKPTTPVTPGISDTDFTNLTDRVQDLEYDIEDKQDKIGVGDGLVFEENTVSLNNAYLQLPAKVGEMQNTINTKVTQTEVNTTVNTALNSYYTKTEIDGMISPQGAVDIKTIYDAQADDRKYVTVVDQFSESIFDE